jgi:hypothetical protein
MKVGLLCAVVAGAFAAVGAASAGGDVATNLATLDCRCSPSQHQVAPYRIALNTLRPKCTEDASKLAGTAWFMHTDLAKYGKHVSGLGALRLMNKSIPRALHKTSCEQIAAALLVLMEG